MPIRQTTLTGDIFNLNSPSPHYNQALQDHYDSHGTLEDIIETNDNLTVVEYATKLATNPHLIEAYLQDANLFKNMVQAKTITPSTQHLALVIVNPDTNRYGYTIDLFDGTIPEEAKDIFFNVQP